jgi:protein TonB
MDLAPEAAAPAPSQPSPEPPFPPQPVPESLPPPPIAPVPSQVRPPPEPAPQAAAPATPLVSEPPVALPPPREAAPKPLPQVSPPMLSAPARPAPRRPPPQRAVTRQPLRPTQDNAAAQASTVPAPSNQAAPLASAAATPPAPMASAAPSSSAVPGWRGELIGRLQRAKRYPDAARERDEQGVATVTFTMDRNGHVLSASLVHSSGSPALDEEAVAMVHRADPLPPMPAELAGNTVKFTLPVTFSLR